MLVQNKDARFLTLFCKNCRLFPRKYKLRLVIFDRMDYVNINVVTNFTMMRDFMYRIMIIEDDEKIRRIVADTLKKWQYDVVEVTEFDQVLTQFVQGDPHLVQRGRFGTKGILIYIG
jgi:hypothetical protein